MSSKKKINFLIVGQGIAGTTLAHKLYELGNSVHLIDNKHQSSSSLIAGGVIHPMSFKRVILSWKADSLIPAAKGYYDAFEARFRAKVFHELEMTRVFSSMEEQNNWQGRMADLPMKDIISDEELTFLKKLSNESKLNTIRNMNGILPIRIKIFEVFILNIIFSISSASFRTIQNIFPCRIPFFSP